MNVLEKMHLKGKKAFVTGAAHGIGKACAIGLAQAGADVAVIDINKEGILQTVEEIKKYGVDSIAIQADITKEDEITIAMEQILQRFNHLDIAFCNAGTFQNIPAEEMPLDEFKRVIDTNLTGAFITARAAGKAMIPSKSGSIILTASMSGHIANIPQSQCAYNASKAGVIMLGKSLAIEWAKHGIRVNTISPGYIYTWSDKPIPEEEIGKTNFEQWTPLKRFGQAEELQGLVLYLASDASSFVTGSDHLIDGGYTAF
jgi:NAD(P)-dependent dehydrogenase (short-subunit alcohol dehydrogenase family)